MTMGKNLSLLTFLLLVLIMDSDAKQQGSEILFTKIVNNKGCEPLVPDVNQCIRECFTRGDLSKWCTDKCTKRNTTSCDTFCRQELKAASGTCAPAVPGTVTPVACYCLSAP